MIQKATNIFFLLVCSLLLTGKAFSLVSTQSGITEKNTIWFESNFPQSDWDVKRQTARFVGAEPALFLDDTFILGKRNITRTLHPLQKRLQPLSFPIPEYQMKSIRVQSVIPASDGHGLFVYCLGSYKDKSLYTIFRTFDGITFEPIWVDQIPSKKVWADCPSEKLPRRNNILDLNFDGFGKEFSSYYSTFFRVENEPKPYRAILITLKPRPRKVKIIQSKDGLEWESMPNQSVTDIPYEANKPTYDPFHDRYLGYLRLWDPHNGPVSRWRKVIFSEAIMTPDSITWTDQKLVFEANESDGPSTDIYFMQVTGYAGAYIGIPVLYHRPSCLNPDVAGKFHCELAYSQNGQDWKRICQGHSILSTGPRDSWNAGLVSPGTSPIMMNDSLYFYFNGRKYHHDEIKPGDFRNHTGLATLRVDGFVSMDAGEETGTLVTTPFWPKGKYLYINADASDGEIRVEVLQDYYYVELRKMERNPDQVKGLFRVENCIPFTGNETAHRVEWKKGENFKDSFPSDWNKFLPEQKKKRTFSKRAIALKFYMKNAKLYSFWFADEKLPLEKGRLIPITK